MPGEGDINGESGTILSDAKAVAVQGDPSKQPDKAADPIDPTKAVDPKPAKEPEKPADPVDPTKADDPAKPIEPVVPEDYEPPKLPEGVVLDEEGFNLLKPIAKELKLTQDQVQKLIDLQVSRDTTKRTADAAAWKDTIKGWEDQIKADKEFGGPHMTANVALAAKALDTFGSIELRKALADYGVGSHPEVYRFVVKVGKALSEGTFTPGGSGKNDLPKDQAQARSLFPSLYKDK